jgi:hypothetical protein
LIDVDPELSIEPLTRKKKTTMIIDGADQIQVPDEGKVGLPHDIDLPEIIRFSGFETLDGLDRWKGNPVEVMASQGSPYRFPMDPKLEMLLDESSRPMLAFQLALDYLVFNLWRDPPPPPSSLILKSVGPVFEESPATSFDRSPRTIETLKSLFDFDLALNELENDVFFNSNRCNRRMVPPSRPSYHATF